MIRIDKLIEELRKFPPDALAFGYEGEITGIVILDINNKAIGYIKAGEDERDYEGPAIFYVAEPDNSEEVVDD